MLLLRIVLVPKNCAATCTKMRINEQNLGIIKGYSIFEMTKKCTGMARLIIDHGAREPVNDREFVNCLNNTDKTFFLMLEINVQLPGGTGNDTKWQCTPQTINNT